MLTWLTQDPHTQRQGMAQCTNDEREDSICYVCHPQTEYVPQSFCHAAYHPEFVHDGLLCFSLCDCIICIQDVT